jgi:hypothetical protein
MDYIGKYSPLTTGIEDNIQIIQENQLILIQKSGNEEGKRMPFFHPLPLQKIKSIIQHGQR